MTNHSAGIFKIALLFPINLFPKKISKEIIINASYEGICVEFERIKLTTLVFLLSNCLQVSKFFYD